MKTNVNTNVKTDVKYDVKYDLKTDVKYDVQKIRSQFPALSRQTSNGSPIHLDNPAGTQVPQRVLERMNRCMIECNGNLGGHFETSIAAGKLVQEAHEWVADFVNAADSSEIIFGQNMTSLTFALSRSIGRELKAGDEILLTRSEHDANVAPWLMLAEDLDLVIHWIDLDPESFELDLSSLDNTLSSRTKVVAINYASNLTGTINDVKTIARAAKAVGALVYVDAVQFAPHGVIDVQELGCDFLVCSSYKFYGPHYGILWGRAELLKRLTAYKVRASSNELPFKFVTGTTNREQLAGIIGALEHFEWVGQQFGDGLEQIVSGRSDRQKHLRAGTLCMHEYDASLTRRLISGLENISGTKIIGIRDPAAFDRRVSTVSFTQEGYDPAEVARFMAEKGIYIWSGHNYGIEPVNRLGLMEAGGVIRVGPTHYNTADEIDCFLSTYKDFLAQD